MSSAIELDERITVFGMPLLYTKFLPSGTLMMVSLESHPTDPTYHIAIFKEGQPPSFASLLRSEIQTIMRILT